MPTFLGPPQQSHHGRWQLPLVTRLSSFDLHPQHPNINTNKGQYPCGHTGCFRKMPEGRANEEKTNIHCLLLTDNTHHGTSVMYASAVAGGTTDDDSDQVVSAIELKCSWTGARNSGTMHPLPGAQSTLGRCEPHYSRLLVPFIPHLFNCMSNYTINAMSARRLTLKTYCIHTVFRKNERC